MEFYGRTDEMRALSNMGKIYFIVLWGRRRIGKTSMVIRSFKENLYFFIGRKASPLLLEEFTNVIRENWKYVPTFRTWEEFFMFLFKEYPGTIILDEFQNLHFSDPSVFSTLQNVLFKVPEHRLVVVGSYVGMMKRIFMDPKEPLFGRTTGNMKVQPLPFHVVCSILEDLGIQDMQEKVSIYSVFGGVPYHYVLMEVYGVKGFDDSLEKLVFSSLAPLKNDVKNVLMEEFGRDYSTYFSILQSIASGKCSLSDISNHSGIPIQSLGKYLKELSEVYDLITRITPYGIVKKGIYRIRDPFTRFWFRYVESNVSELESGRGHIAMDRALSERSMISSWEFETIIRDLLGSRYDKVCNWWNRSGEEIDAIAIDEANRTILFAEVKWTNRPMDDGDLNELISRSELVRIREGFKRKYLLVSRSGFSKRVDDDSVEYWDLRTLREMVDSKNR